MLKVWGLLNNVQGSFDLLPVLQIRLSVFLLSFIHLTTLPQKKGRKVFKYVEKREYHLKHKPFSKWCFETLQCELVLKQSLVREQDTSVDRHFSCAMHSKVRREDLRQEIWLGQ